MEEHFGQQTSQYGYVSGQSKQAGAPQEHYGFAIAALVLGILSMTLCVAVGSLLGVLGITFGSVSCARREGKRRLAVIGIVTSLIGIFLGAVCAFVIFQRVRTEMAGLFAEPIVTAEPEEGQEQKAEEPFTGKGFRAKDGSVIYFAEDGSFQWYRDDADHSNYYYTGTYEVYQGDTASSYVVNDLGEYGVTQEELEDYFARNGESSVYAPEYFTCLILHNEACMIDGKNEIAETYVTNYMGFFKEGYYDAMNMASGEYASFEVVD